jgi:RimJ/RimL family protein N-acetyltransferase
MMEFGPVTLEGRHVRLEPLTLQHVDALSAIGLDDELWRWTTAGVRTRDDMQRYVETALEWQRAGTALPFATMLPGGHQVIGSTRFANIDRPNRRAEIGWTWIAKAWQRTAANTEAKFLMLRHAFEALGCIRVELKTDALNAVSRRAIVRIGAKEEGTLRSHMITETGRRRDSVYFSVIESEWPEVKQGLLSKLDRP